MCACAVACHVLLWEIDKRRISLSSSIPRHNSLQALDETRGGRIFGRIFGVVRVSICGRPSFDLQTSNARSSPDGHLGCSWCTIFGLQTSEFRFADVQSEFRFADIRVSICGRPLLPPHEPLLHLWPGQILHQEEPSDSGSCLAFYPSMQMAHFG